MLRQVVVALSVAALSLSCTKGSRSKTSSNKSFKQELSAKIANTICNDLNKFNNLEESYKIPGAAKKVSYRNNTLQLDSGVVRCQRGNAKNAASWQASVYLADERELIKKPRYFVYTSEAAQTICGALNKMDRMEAAYKVPAKKQMVSATRDTIRLGDNTLVCRKINQELKAYITI